jgi:predicted nucleic acid-binding protein
MLALDTDILVHWANADCQHHDAVLSMIRGELAQPDGALAFIPQVCWEFIHVCTDARRFEHPLTMEDAIARVRAWWDAPEAVRINLAPRVVHRTLELLKMHALGRKRILDTVLAATLEAAGIRRLASLNGGDFEVFPFVEIVDPVLLRASAL